jgi:hypothetical protein
LDNELLRLPLCSWRRAVPSRTRIRWRSGANGKNFFNIEGSVNGAFASYGVADFAFGSLPYPVVGITSIELQLTQSNAAFSATGPVVISLDQSSPLANIQPGTSPLANDGVDPGTATDVTQGDLSLLALGGGPFIYTVGANGNVDSYTFTLDGASTAALVSRLNSGGTIRLVIGSGAASVAATWAGFSNATYSGPMLNLDVEYNTGVPARAASWGKVKADYR